MKRLTTKFLSFILALLMLLSVNVPAFANVNNEKSDFREFIGISGKEYSTEETFLYEPDTVEKIMISNNQLVLEHNGTSEFVDVIGELKNGKYVNLTNVVEWLSNDNDIVIADGGRILAVRQGETKVDIKFGTHEQTINVSVKENFNISNEINRINSSQAEELNNTRNYPLSANRTSAIDKAKGFFVGN